MENNTSLLGRTYSKEELLNSKQSVLVINTDVRADTIDIESVADRVDTKTRKLVAALPKRLKAKE